MEKILYLQKYFSGKHHGTGPWDLEPKFFCMDFSFQLCVVSVPDRRILGTLPAVDYGTIY